MVEVVDPNVNPLVDPAQVLPVAPPPPVQNAPGQWNPSAVLPDNLPPEFAALAGQTYDSLAQTQRNSRQQVTTLSDQNTALRQKIEELSRPAEQSTEPTPEDLSVTRDQFVQQLESVQAGGSVDPDFVKAINEHGLTPGGWLGDIVPKLFSFIQYQDSEFRGGMQANIGIEDPALAQAKVEAIVAWAKAGNIDPAEWAVYERWGKEGNWSWVAGLSEKLASIPAASDPGQRFRSPVQAPPAEAKPFTHTEKDTLTLADFNAELASIANNNSLGPAQKAQQRNALIARREAQNVAAGRG